MGLLVAVGVAAEVTVSTVLTSVAIVGGVLSVVGTVTKNPVLADIGLGLGVVGGVGALASSALGVTSTALFGTDTAASVADDAASAAGDIGSAAASGASDAAAAAGDVSSAAGAVGDAASATATSIPDAIGSLSEGMSDAEANAAPPVVSNANAPTVANASDPTSTTAYLDDTGDLPTSTKPPALIGSDPSATNGAWTDTTANPTATLGKPAAADPTLSPGTTSPPPPSTGSAATSGTSPGDTGWTDTTAADKPSTLKNLLDFADKHPTAAYASLQGVSSLLSGWTSTLTPAQVAALNAQAAQNQAAANLTTQQTQNLAQPKAVASSAPVTGTPQTLVPAMQQQPGFINQAPSTATTAPAVNVTGKAA